MTRIDSRAELARAIDQPAYAGARSLLATRYDQLTGASYELAELAIITIVDPTDRLSDIEAAVGFPIATNLIDETRLEDPDFMPSWEYAERHPSGWTEIVFVLNDDGFAEVILVPEVESIDPALRDLCRLADRSVLPAGHAIAP